jgi:malonyl-CoA/methylmalonyl-CoA synthetase
MMNSETLTYCFRNTSSRLGEKKAITFLRKGHIESEISYKDLDKDANRLARSFLDMGVTKGDRILFFFEKSLFFVVAHLAAQKIGAVGVPLNPGFKKSEMVYLVGDAEANLAITGPAQAPLLEEIAPELTTLIVDTQKPYEEARFFTSFPDSSPGIEMRPEDPGLIIYTSGTTGKPKGAILTRGNLVHDAEKIIKVWEISEADVLCHALPLFHVHGLCFALHTALIAGAHVLMLDAFTPETATRILANKEGENSCTIFMAVPSIYAKLMDYLGERKMDIGHMRLWTSGSAPLLAEDFERIKITFGQEPVEREGMTETGMNFSNPVRGKRKAGSIGIPLPGVEVRVVNPETRQDVAPGETGEIWLKGSSISPGYWKKPDETANAFVDGWFRSGDLGRVDQEGYYYLTDRIKHIIISGGENISPKEVEAVINRVEGVAESSVVGVTDEKWGEKVVAAVVPKSGATIDPDMIQAYCKQHLHNWKCPKAVVLLKELPRNTMGKVLKEEVKKFFLGSRGAQ